MKKTPLPHQLLARDYCRATQHPFLAMKMRLGKTFVWIDHVRSAFSGGGRHLIIAPGPVVEAWEDHLLEEHISYTLLQAFRTKDMEWVSAQQPGWYLINSEALLHREWIAKLPWDSVAADESTFMKNPQAMISKIMCRNFRAVKMRGCLSANPAPEGPENWFMQFKFLHGSFLGFDNYWKFRAALFHPIGHTWVPKKGAFNRIVAEAQRLAYFLTPGQAGLGNVHIHEKRYVDLPGKLRKAYDTMEKEFSAEIGGESLETKWSTVQSIHLAKMAGGWKGTYDHKIKEVLGLLKGELSGEPVIFWCRFVAELRHLSEALERNNISSDLLYGARSYDEKKQAIRGFRAGRTRCLLVQFRVGAKGLDLSRSSVNIFYSNEYGAEPREHALQRIENFNKKESLLSIDIIARDTVDEDALAAHLEKKAGSQVAFLSRMWDHMQVRRKS